MKSGEGMKKLKEELIRLENIIDSCESEGFPVSSLITGRIEEIEKQLNI